MSVEDLDRVQEQFTGNVAMLLDDDPGGARARLEQLLAAKDDAVTRLERELKDLAKLRDNFHSLYREERQLRAESDRVAAERSSERDRLEEDLIVVRGDVDRLQRMLKRLQEAGPAPAVAAIASAPIAPAPMPPATAGASPEAIAAAEQVRELQREAGMLRAHAAELEGAVFQRGAELAAANERVASMEREVVLARTQLAAAARSDSSDAVAEAASAAELAAAARRLHDLEGELASLRLEHSGLVTAHERTIASRDALREQLAAEQKARHEGESYVTGAEQRVQQAMLREHEAIRAADDHRLAAERSEQQLQAAQATIAVLETRVHDIEAARADAERRISELQEELDFVRSSVLTGRSEPQPAKRGLLPRRRSEPAKAVTGRVEPHPAATVEVSGAPAEDVESALHRRLFGGE